MCKVIQIQKRLQSQLLLPSLDGVSIFACNDLQSRGVDHLVGLHFERGVLDNEGPDVIAEAVRV